MSIKRHIGNKRRAFSRWTLLLALFSAFALFAAACGDDDDTTETTQTTAPAAEQPDDSEPTDDEPAAEAPAEDEPDDDGTMDDEPEAEAPADDDPMDEMSMTPGDGVSVTQARANWSTGYMQAAIYAALLRELGYDVSEPADLELAPSNAYAAMAQREFDFWANSWYPNHDSFIAAEMPGGTLVSDHVSKVGLQAGLGGIEGFLTNKSVVEEHGIKTLEQLVNDDELFQLYEAADPEPGDGVLQLFGCPEGWGCNIVISDVIAARGWSDKVQQIEVGGYDATIAEAVARSRNGTPFIAYTWSPSFYTNHLGPGDRSMWLAQDEGASTLLGTDVCTNDPCNLLITADIQVTANNEFLGENPAAAKLLELVEISVVDIALQNARYDTGGENTTEDVNRHADDWIDANRDIVDGWLDEARKAA